MQRNYPRGRYAPSPTGPIHIGNARTALAAWLSIRSRGGTFVWRLEDIDGPRVIPGMAEAAISDLSWLGLDWDEGPDRGGPFSPYVQSERTEAYDAALQKLHGRGFLFPCRRSRKDLAALASAPHGDEIATPYPVSFRPGALPDDWYEALCLSPDPEAAIRFKVHDRLVSFKDRICGTITEQVDETVGDFVLKRRDGIFAYQLAVVVDDLLMEIDDVVRGADLLSSTGRQIQLIEALGGQVPAYAHVPLVLNARGEKLSKRDAGLSLAELRAAGFHPQRIVGYLAFSLGLIDRPVPCTPEDLIHLFDRARIRLEPWVLPEDLAGQLQEG